MRETNYTDHSEIVKEIKDAELQLSHCKRQEELAKETVKERKAATVKAVERLRALARGERGMFDDEASSE
jgi:hypothetical protein